MEIVCPNCKKRVRIPESYSKSKGKCPKCRKIIDFLEIDLPVQPVKVELFPEYFDGVILGKKVNDYEHPVLNLFKKHRKKLIEYTGSLNTLYDFIKTGKYNRVQYQSKKYALKGKYLSHFIEDIDKLEDFSLENTDKIFLWLHLFSIYPYKRIDSDTDVILNLFQRYDIASIIESAYMSRGIENLEYRIKLIYFSIQSQRNKILIEELIGNIKEAGDYETLRSRVEKLQNDNGSLVKLKYEINKTDLNRIYEDFAYGINWIKMYID